MPVAWPPEAAPWEARRRRAAAAAAVVRLCQAAEAAEAVRLSLVAVEAEAEGHRRFPAVEAAEVPSSPAAA